MQSPSLNLSNVRYFLLPLGPIETPLGLVVDSQAWRADIEPSQSYQTTSPSHAAYVGHASDRNLLESSTPMV